MAELLLKGVEKTFGATRVLHPIDIALADGEFLVLVGPSGCGKSTLMNLIAGLEEPSAGRIVLGGKDITEVGPADRNISMVFQSYALYPNMSVADNIAFPLEMRGVAKAERDKTVAEVSGMLQIDHLLTRKPRQLSGGQRQRVAIGRALARHPQLFLFDEPLSNLDAQAARGHACRDQAPAHAHRRDHHLCHPRPGGSHDPGHAHRGAQWRAASSSWPRRWRSTTRPANRFVAEFIGSPSINTFEAQRDAHGELRLPDGTALGTPLAGATGPIVLGVRPEDLEIREDGQLQGTVSLVEPTGPETYALVDLGHTEITVRMSGLPNVQPGIRVRVHVPAAAVHAFDAASGQRLN